MPPDFSDVVNSLCRSDESRKLMKTYFEEAQAQADRNGLRSLPEATVHVCAWFAEIRCNKKIKPSIVLKRIQQASSLTPMVFMNSVTTIHIMLTGVSATEASSGIPIVTPPIFESKCGNCNARGIQCIRLSPLMSCASCYVTKTTLCEYRHRRMKVNPSVVDGNSHGQSKARSSPVEEDEDEAEIIELPSSFTSQESIPTPATPKRRDKLVHLNEQSTLKASIKQRAMAEDLQTQQSTPVPPRTPTKRAIPSKLKAVKPDRRQQRKISAFFQRTPAAKVSQAPEVSSTSQTKSFDRAAVDSRSSTDSGSPEVSEILKPSLASGPTQPLGKRRWQDVFDDEPDTRKKARDNDFNETDYEHGTGGGFEVARDRHDIKVELVKAFEEYLEQPSSSPPPTVARFSSSSAYDSDLPTSSQDATSSPGNTQIIDLNGPSDALAELRKATVHIANNIAAYVLKRGCADKLLHVKILDLRSRLTEFEYQQQSAKAPAVKDEDGVFPLEAVEAMVLQAQTDIISYVKKNGCQDVRLKIMIMDMDTRLSLQY